MLMMKPTYDYQVSNRRRPENVKKKHIPTNLLSNNNFDTLDLKLLSNIITTNSFNAKKVII